MDTALIIEKIELGIAKLLEREIDNLRRALNEVNVSANLAFYLKPLFETYDVEPEYNGDIDKPNDRKALDIARNRIEEIKRKPNLDDNSNLRPDIIIHRRRTNKYNLVVIEVKKDIHPQREKDYDLIKLEHLTINYLGNHYNYKLGMAIIFGTGKNAGAYEIKYFQDGLPKSAAQLT